MWADYELEVGLEELDILGFDSGLGGEVEGCVDVKL